MKTCSKIW